jgi:hypothetical protein
MATTKKEAAPKPPVEEEAKPVVKKEVPQYVSSLRVWHPYQRLYIDSVPRHVQMDSWLECQLAAGIVERV